MPPPPVHGHLETLLLAALARGPAHGYAVIEALRMRSDGVLDLPEGTVYPALYRLEDAGLLVSGPTVVGGRKRRVYELTGAGRAALTEQTAGWRRFEGAVNAILKEDPWPSTA